MLSNKKLQNIWTYRRDITITIIGWIILLAMFLWVIDHFSRTIILLVFAAFLAYALVPLVTFLQRYIPRFLAILFVYFVFLGGLGFLIYFVVTTAVQQLIIFSHNFYQYASTLAITLHKFGISQTQIADISKQLTAQAEGLTGSVVPFLGSIFTIMLDTILVGVISIYLLIDGQRLAQWVRTNMPKNQKNRVIFLINTLQRIVGGYIRGQVIIAFLISVLVWIGMSLLHVPYAVLLAAITFVLEFIPILGSFISGAICVLLALTKGWLIALIVLIYFIFIHIIEGDIIGPRIVGKAIGLHPLVSIIAVIAGGELYGIIGVLVASPIAGVVQAILIAMWAEWRIVHPEEFEKTKKKSYKTL